MNNLTTPDNQQLSTEQQGRLAIVLERYLDQLENGEQPDLQKVSREHPDLLDALVQYIPSLRSPTVRTGTQSQPSRSSPHPQAAAERDDVPLTPEPKSSSTSVTAEDDPFPNRLGDYELVEEIGRGGMGIVFKARQLSLERVVAIKVLPQAAVWDAKHIARFQNEAQAAAQLNHPNLVAVYSIGKDRGTYYYSMPLIQGISLENAIAYLRTEPKFSHGFINPSRGSLPMRSPRKTLSKQSGSNPARGCSSSRSKSSTKPKGGIGVLEPYAKKAIQSETYIRRVAVLVAQAAEALHYAHQHGIVHRDIKPSNLLVDDDGKLWITDFGLAQVAGDNGLTRSGDVLGTLKYMSPEQAIGKSHWVDCRSDIYSLGVTLYELLTLHPVVDSEDRMTMLRQIQTLSPPPARSRNSGIPIELENVLQKAISKDREDRYGSAELFAEDLKRYLACGRPLANRRGLRHWIARSVRRHAQWSAMALATLLLALFASLPAAYWVFHQNARLRGQNALAIGQLQTAHQSLDRLSAPFMPQLQMIPGTEFLQKQIAAENIAYLQQFLVYAEQTPGLDAETIAARLRLASIHGQQGNTAQGIDCYQKVVEGMNGGSPRGGNPNDLLLAHHGLAMLLSQTGAHTQVIDLLTRILDSKERISILGSSIKEARDPDWETILRLDLAHAHAALGDTQSADKQWKIAVALLPTATADGREAKPPLYDLNHALVSNLLRAANTDSIATDLTRHMIDAATEIAKSDLQASQNDLADEFQMSMCYLARGVHACRIGDAEESIQWFERALKITQDLATRQPTNFRLRYEHAVAMNSLGQAKLSTGQLENARKLFSDAAKTLEVMDALHPDPVHRSSLAGTLHNLAAVASRTQNTAEARQLLERAIELQSRAVDSAPDDPQFRTLLRFHQKTLDDLKKSVG